MNDKISLNFDFFDDEAKKDLAPKETEKAVEHQKSQVKTDNIGFIQYFKACYSNFVEFAKRYLTKKSPKYLILAAYILGVGSAADRISGSLQDYTNWTEVWVVILFGGIISGAMVYYIAGWFYNVRIKWSKGKDDIDTSRNIYIFSSLPVAAVSILSLIINQLAYGSDYFTYFHTEASSIDLIFIFVLLAAIIYSIRVSYKAAREVLLAEKGRAIGWFIIAPTLFYICIWLMAAA